MLEGEDDFFLQVLLNPDDDTARLVYADWLEEQGDPRAEYLRLEMEEHAVAERGERSPRALRERLDAITVGLDRVWRWLMTRTSR